MLATILKSKTATEVSIKIMDAFVLMRHFIIENRDIYKSLNNINNKIMEHDEKLNYIFSRFDKKDVFYIRTSLNHIGEKLFSINKLDDKIVKEHLINYVLDIIKDSCIVNN